MTRTRRTRLLWGAALTASFGAALVVPAGVAAARTAASVTLSAAHHRIEVSQQPTFQYGTSGVPTSGKLLLQRQFGTAGVWKRVATTTPTSGTVTAPKLPTLGKYRYRLVAETATGHVVATSKRNTIRVYGNVLLPGRNSPCDFAPGCDGTLQVGNTIFTYTDGIGDPEDMGDQGVYPDYAQSLYFKQPGSSCRSLTVNFANDEQQPGTTVYLEFVQQSLDPVYASTQTGQIGEVTVALDGGPLNIDASYKVANDKHYEAVVYTVHGSCFTRDGLR
ncbi:MAG TPA: hypothetical protein VHD81_05030 [Mycobacteriales bacterium]|nr:hypothetical protein [Mycobacteriales bacterium]